jgi:ABC-type antimicrobial peptide transport system permease subunit
LEEQKDKEADLAKFKKALGEEVEAHTDEMTFVVVGLTPIDDSNEWKAGREGLWGMVRKLTGSSLSQITVVPRSYIGTNPKFEKLFAPPEKSGKVSFGDSYVVEFGTRQEAVDFVAEKSNNGEQATAEKPFRIDFYGNNSVVLDELFGTLTRIVLIALGIVILISILFLSSTFVKIITTARKEIAVFRAIGFKKTDIVRIYQVYSLIFAFIIAVCAVALGLLAAFVISGIYSAPLASELMALFSIIDSEKTVSLFQPSIIDILVLPLIVPLTAIICSTFPALLAIRRNPIKDLREE